MTAGARRAALLVLTVLVAATWSPSASARENESFGLTPFPEAKDGTVRLGFDIPLETGATFEDSVKIYNRTNQSLPLAVYPADAEATEDDTITAGLRTNDPKGVGTWIDLARDDVELGPRREVIVTFRVNVKSADPSPKLGAIVVENTTPGLAAAQRLHLVVRTVPANTPTTSVRVRPLLIRSPWVIVAMLGLIVAIALVWTGTRRARRAKDVLVPAGELERAADESPIVPEASQPVIKRLGVTAEPARTATAVLERSTRRKPTMDDDRPLLDDAFLVEVDPEDEEDEEDEQIATDADPPLGYEVDVGVGTDEDVEDDQDDDIDLPPARHVRPRTSQARRSASSGARRKRATRKKPTRKASTPRRKSSSAKKTASTRKRAAKATPRKRTAKPRAAKANYIPLDDL